MLSGSGSCGPNVGDNPASKGDGEVSEGVLTRLSVEIGRFETTSGTSGVKMRG
jgi:hypothetical protein